MAVCSLYSASDIHFLMEKNIYDPDFLGMPLHRNRVPWETHSKYPC